MNSHNENNRNNNSLLWQLPNVFTSIIKNNLIFQLTFVLLSEPKMPTTSRWYSLHCFSFTAKHFFLLQQNTFFYTGHSKISATLFKENKEKIILVKLYRTQTTQNEGLNTQQDTTGMLWESKASIHFFRKCTLPNTEWTCDAEGLWLWNMKLVWKPSRSRIWCQ